MALVAIGDLNGDSKPDVVVANGGTKEVTVFLNRGQGTFRLGREYATGGFALFAAIGFDRETGNRARQCRVGKIRRAYSTVERGRVISQKPKFGAVLVSGGKVTLVVSRVRTRS